jgi:hypothetical protein
MQSTPEAKSRRHWSIDDARSVDLLERERKKVAVSLYLIAKISFGQLAKGHLSRHQRQTPVRPFTLPSASKVTWRKGEGTCPTHGWWSFRTKGSRRVHGYTLPQTLHRPMERLASLLIFDTMLQSGRSASRPQYCASDHLPCYQAKQLSHSHEMATLYVFI